MTPERWKQIEKVYDAALKKDADGRDAFLDQACEGDEELRREVASLLASDARAGSFLAAPAAEVVTKVIAAEMAASPIGRRISHYQMLSLLGAGGMGEVYLAEDTRLGRKVALKLLPVEFTADAGRVRRFTQEARAASALNHPNIITIHEIGEASTEAGSRQYIVAEYVEGETLRRRMASATGKEAPSRIEALEAIDITAQIAAALSAAHEAGITHRDIKPENVMVRRDGIVKVLDFGLAKLTEPASPTTSFLVDTQAPTIDRNSTEAGVVMGTPRYMSPEQARGEKMDARTDIFSLGVMLYEMVTGHAPFAGATTGEVIAAILRDEPPPLGRHAPDTPPELERILSRALRKAREERYQAASELLADLKRLKRRLEQKDELKNEMAWAGQPGLESDVSAGGEAAFLDMTLKQAKITAAGESARAADAVTNHRPRIFLVAMAALAVAIFFYAFTCLVAFRYGSTDKFGYRTRLIDGEQTIREVHGRSPAAGLLEIGDRIVALNGDDRFHRVEPFVLLQTFPEGQSYTLRVRRVTNGRPAELEFTLSCTSYPTSSVARWELTWTHLLRALVCLAVAFFIIWLKPGERFSLLAFSAFLTIGVVESRVVLNPLQEQLTGAPRVIMLLFWAVTGGHLFVPFAYQTAYMFPPEAFRKGRFWTALQWLLYAGLVVGASRGFVARLFAELPQQLDLLYRYATRFAAIKSFADWYYLVGLVAISAVLARNFLSATDKQQRRRIKWVIVGTLIATVALTAVEAARLGLEASGPFAATGSAQFVSLAWAANALALAFPLSWAYAILNRRIYDVSFVVRRSLQYLLAKNALRLMLALPLLGLAGAVYANRDRTLAGLLFHNSLWFYASLLAAVALGLAYRYNLREWLDRYFFREAYQQDKILRELTEEIRHLDSLTEMARRVSQKVDAALHPERLYLFHREEGRSDLTLGYSSADYSSGGAIRDPRIPAEFELLRFLEYQGGAQNFPFPAKTRLPSQEKQWLANLGASLIVPMSGTDGRLQGLLVLGPKKSETPYTGGDQELLEMLAGQIALVHENVQLNKRVARDRRALREVQARASQPASESEMSESGEASR
ncbi:MAG: GAF domain-containing serine/threonine-protein kinase [Acidobacteria bacterium]|nr:GAF domain-containing serine/threonine-protein kinase [Acidobacteriota bacterium]